MLSCLGSVQTTLNRESAETVKKIWEYVAKIADEFEHPWPCYLIDLVLNLLDATCLDEKDSLFLESVCKL